MKEKGEMAARGTVAGERIMKSREKETLKVSQVQRGMI